MSVWGIPGFPKERIRTMPTTQRPRHHLAGALCTWFCLIPKVTLP